MIQPRFMQCISEDFMAHMDYLHKGYSYAHTLFENVFWDLCFEGSDERIQVGPLQPGHRSTLMHDAYKV